MTPQQFSKHVEKIVTAKHEDPFGFLGMHDDGKKDLVVRAFLPQARKVSVLAIAENAIVAELPRVHA